MAAVPVSAKGEGAQSPPKASTVPTTTTVPIMTTPASVSTTAVPGSTKAAPGSPTTAAPAASTIPTTTTAPAAATVPTTTTMPAASPASAAAPMASPTAAPAGAPAAPTTTTATTTAPSTPITPTHAYTTRTISNFGDSMIPAITRIFQNHAPASNGIWSKQDLIRFLTIQGDERAPEILEKAATTILSESGCNTALDLKGFMDYIASAAAQAQAPLAKQLTDLSWPLANYFISSSHNTYLTGNQLYSDSSTNAYTNVLRRGCRCIEVDVWDGGDSDIESDSSDSSANSPTGRPEDEEGISKEEKKRRKRERKEREKYEIGPDGEKRERKKNNTWGRLKSKLEKATGGSSSPTSTTATSPPKPGSGSPVAVVEQKPARVSEPQVFHGYTLTKEVSFRDVCYAIRDAAFLSTDLPLIVSLETHCSPPQQEKMVEIMREAWEGMLADPPAETDPYATHLPTPQDLRGKILVKCKYAPPETSPIKAVAVAAAAAATATTTPTTTSTPVPRVYDDDDAAAAPEDTTKKLPKPSKIIQALSRMGIYTRGISFKSLTQPEASMPTHIFSLSEKRALDVHEDSPARLFEHNRRYLMRTYPSGMRIRSSNLDPPVFWRKGLQVVALNWQRWDEGMMLNEAMFSDTGGYVLKPEGYRSTKDPRQWDASKHVPQTQATAVPHRSLDLMIEVLAAQDIPLPEDVTKADKVDPYVKVELHISRPEDNLLPSDDKTLAPPGTAPPNDPVPVPASPPTPTAASTFQPNQNPPTSPPRKIVSLPTRTDQARAHEGEYKARTKTKAGTSPSFSGDAESVLRFQGVPDVVDELAFVRFTVWDDNFGRDDIAAWACVRLDRLKTGYRIIPLMNMRGVQTTGVLLVRISKMLR